VRLGQQTVAQHPHDARAVRSGPPRPERQIANAHPLRSLRADHAHLDRPFRTDDNRSCQVESAYDYAADRGIYSFRKKSTGEGLEEEEVVS
jgi:hypothetical protein